MVEVILALAITGAVFGGMLIAYIQAAKRAEWTGYSLAAQAMAVQQLEQARSAVWDPAQRRNEIANLNLNSWASNNLGSGLYQITGYTWTNLDMPTSGGNFTRATNFVTVRMLNLPSVNPPVPVQLIQVQTTWPFTWRSSTRLFTNTICTYVSPDNRDVSTLFN